tara:strand:- start:36 stop:626 length:591 start_codon:yes stop_codon:yes gene_type:complete
MNKRKLVLVHGLWNSPKLFFKLINYLNYYELQCFAPSLPHSYGKVSLNKLAYNLNKLIISECGNNDQIDLLGFSMGGIVSRLWLQDYEGYKRINKFISVGSPQKGTLTANIFFPLMFQGISDMAIYSKLIKQLDKNSSFLTKVKCISYFSYWDLMVFPGWRAYLPYGEIYPINVFFHKQLILNDMSIKIIGKEILK